MSTPLRTDPADPAIAAVREGMRLAFTGQSSQPPIGGGSDTVRLFAGDGVPLAAFRAYSDEVDCGDPFLWVRLVARFRTDPLPAPLVSPDGCDKPVGITVEAGVARCATVDLDPSWDDYAREAEVSLDDSWRVEMALCQARTAAVRSGAAVAGAIDAILPVGPEGGVIAWYGSIHFQL